MLHITVYFLTKAHAAVSLCANFVPSCMKMDNTEARQRTNIRYLQICNAVKIEFVWIIKPFRRVAGAVTNVSEYQIAFIFRKKLLM
jgi:hypothetical protein